MSARKIQLLMHPAPDARDDDIIVDLDRKLAYFYPSAVIAGSSVCQNQIFIDIVHMTTEKSDDALDYYSDVLGAEFADFQLIITIQMSFRDKTARLACVDGIPHPNFYSFSLLRRGAYRYCKVIVDRIPSETEPGEFDCDWFMFDFPIVTGEIEKRYARDRVPRSSIHIMGLEQSWSPDCIPGWCYTHSNQYVSGPLCTRPRMLAKLKRQYNGLGITYSLPPADRVESGEWWWNAEQRWPFNHHRLVGLFIALFPLIQTPYAMLWIIDEIPRFRLYPRRDKIECLQSVYKSILAILGRRRYSLRSAGRIRNS